MHYRSACSSGHLVAISMKYSGLHCLAMKILALEVSLGLIMVMQLQRDCPVGGSHQKP